MIDTVLGLLHNALTLLFGVYISAAFLGIRMNRRNVLILFAFFSAVGVVSASSFALFGAKVTQQIYPLIIHIPLVLFLMLFYHYKAILAVLSVLTAYLCCQISNWIGILALNIMHLNWVYFSVRIVTTVLVFIAFTSSGIRIKQKRGLAELCYQSASPLNIQCSIQLCRDQTLRYTKVQFLAVWENYLFISSFFY